MPDHFDATVCSALLSLADGVKLTPVLRVRLLEISRGRRYRDIANDHEISVNTVKTESGQILHSLGLSCRHELEDGYRAARRRAEEGSSEKQILELLKVRFE